MCCPISCAIWLVRAPRSTNSLRAPCRWRSCSSASWGRTRVCEYSREASMSTWIMAAITFREAARKKILWTALIAGFGFLIVFGLGLHYQLDDFNRGEMSAFLRYQILSAMLMVGLYTVDLLAVVMTILTSVDTISGEIASGTIQAIATKPVARWEVVVGKW